MKIIAVTVGPHGALRPLLALSAGLREAGHEVLLGSHENYRDLVEAQGVDFVPIAGAAGSRETRDSVTRQFTAAGNPVKYFRALREEAGEIKTAARHCLDKVHEASRDRDMVLCHLHLYAAAFVAERLGIRCVQTYNTPVTPTSAFPSYVSFRQGRDLSGFENRLSHRLRDLTTWLPYRSFINGWRQDALGLPPIGIDGPFRELDRHRCPLLYGLSPSLLPPPEDWPDWVKVTGHWELASEEAYELPEGLEAFVEAGAPPVCIGFGSMRFGDGKARAELVVEAVRRSGLRAVLLSGWAGMEAVELPDTCFMCREVPHRWLFPRCAGSVSAGGIGTVTAALRAGVPVQAIPFGGDSVFWGWQVARLGVGPEPIPIKQLTAERLAAGMRSLVKVSAYRAAAGRVAESMKGEDGIAEGVRRIEAVGALS